MRKTPLLLNPRTYTLSAIILGYALIGDYSAVQQDAIGNWFMAIGQILETNSTIQQAIEEYYQGYTYNTNSKKFKQGGSPYGNNKPIFDYLSPDEQEIKEIKKMLQKMIAKLDEISKN